MLQSYKPSGKYTMSFVTLLPAAAALGALLGVVYQCGIHYIGFVKINFVLWLLCGLAAAGIAGAAMRLAKCRNAMVGAGAGFIIGLSAVAAGHVIEFWLQTRKVSVPVSVDEYVDFRVVSGWTISSASSSSSPTTPSISGWGVWLVWGVELLGIAGMGAGIASRMVRKPFCEACEVWANKSLATFEVPWITPDATQRVKDAQDLDTLLAVSSQPPSPDAIRPTANPKKGQPVAPVGTQFNSMTYSLTGCPVCENTAVLTIKTNSIKQANKKNVAASETVLRTNILLDSAQRDKVLAAARAWGSNSAGTVS